MGNYVRPLLHNSQDHPVHPSHPRHRPAIAIYMTCIGVRYENVRVVVSIVKSATVAVVATMKFVEVSDASVPSKKVRFSTVKNAVPTKMTLVVNDRYVAEEVRIEDHVVSGSVAMPKLSCVSVVVTVSRVLTVVTSRTTTEAKRLDVTVWVETTSSVNVVNSVVVVVVKTSVLDVLVVGTSVVLCTVTIVKLVRTVIVEVNTRNCTVFVVRKVVIWRLDTMVEVLVKFTSDVCVRTDRTVFVNRTVVVWVRSDDIVCVQVTVE